MSTGQGDTPSTPPREGNDLFKVGEMTPNAAEENKGRTRSAPSRPPHSPTRANSCTVSRTSSRSPNPMSQGVAGGRKSSKVTAVPVSDPYPAPQPRRTRQPPPFAGLTPTTTQQRADWEVIDNQINSFPPAPPFIANPIEPIEALAQTPSAPISNTTRGKAHWSTSRRRPGLGSITPSTALTLATRRSSLTYAPARSPLP